MNTTMIALIVFLILMAMIFLGVPVFIAMLGCSVLGFVWMAHGSFTMAFTTFTQTPYTSAASFNYAVIPLFMVVGTLAGVTGIAEGAFDSMKCWLGRIKGGTLFAVIGANAVFGACSGSSVAGSVVFGKMALPELKKQGYNESYSMGCICSAGALSSLIPPSMAIITFCLMAPSPLSYNGKNMTLSVGAALSAGIIPGILTALALCLTVRIVGVIKKGSVPAGGGPKVAMSDKLKSLRFLLPILALFALIIGGTMAGWFAATIGGAIGAVVTCIYAFVKRIPFKEITNCLREAAIMEGAIFPIILSGSIFSKFIAASGIASWLAKAIANIQAPGAVIFLIVIIFYLFCGCVMDMMSMIIITTPVVFPVLASVGYNPYVVVITLVFMMEIASITPPIGMNVFTTSNALRTSPAKIFKGIVPFFLCELAMVFLISFIPQLATLLPGLLGYTVG